MRERGGPVPHAPGFRAPARVGFGPRDLVRPGTKPASSGSGALRPAPAWVAKDFQIHTLSYENKKQGCASRFRDAFVNQFTNCRPERLLQSLRDEVRRDAAQEPLVLKVNKSPPASPEPMTARASNRRFLFLQGPISDFFPELAARLRRDGQEVFRINFNGGDRAFWRGPAIDYRGGMEDWPRFLHQRLSAWRITDLVLFGDCRPLHRSAIGLARSGGVAVHVFEEGYLRPNWITLELGGVNNHSSLPRDIHWYRERASELPAAAPETPVLSSFPRRAAHDVLYNLATWLSTWRYPHYRTHKPWHPFAEYRAGSRRFLSRGRDLRERDRVSLELAGGTRPYFLFPLQLEADFQIRAHSEFGSLAPAIARVIGSFARHAAADALLVVTEHPLDTGIVEQERITRHHAQAEGVADRVFFLRGGSTDMLLQRSRGVVTVNSTLGLLALRFGVPVKTLGRALYDLPGLTFQPALDHFWQRAEAPDAALVECFRRVLAARTQINGGLYHRAAVALAADNAAARLLGAGDSISSAYSGPPARSWPQGVARPAPPEIPLQAQE